MKKYVLLFTVVLGSSFDSLASQENSRSFISGFSKSLNYKFGLAYTSNLKDSSLSEHFSSIVYTSVVSTNYLKNLPLNIAINFVQNNEIEDFLTLGNTIISTSGGIGKGFMRSHSLILPTSKNSRDVKNNLGNITNSFIYSFSKDIYNGVDISASFGLTHNYGLYRYETDLYGNSNIQNLLTETGNISLTYKNLNFSTFFGFAQAFSFSNNLMESYYLGHSFNYAHSKKLSLGISYSSGGSLLAPNGEDLGIQLFDRDNDTFTLNTIYSF
tara:strand:- start:10043 stop:10852 length:810 start_codon:yes stop_codon:yes gene_type:complete